MKRYGYADDSKRPVSAVPDANLDLRFQGLMVASQWAKQNLPIQPTDHTDGIGDTQKQVIELETAEIPDVLPPPCQLPFLPEESEIGSTNMKQGRAAYEAIAEKDGGETPCAVDRKA